MNNLNEQLHYLIKIVFKVSADRADSDTAYSPYITQQILYVYIMLV